MVELGCLRYMCSYIVTPLANKAPVWRHFGYMKDLAIGKTAVGNKVTCKLCRVAVAHSGGTTNLKNHLRSHHRPRYTELFEYELGNSSKAERQRPMDAFCKLLQTLSYAT